ncbi:hypothetical protein NTD82_14005 [Pseudomonas sp. 5P_5.1_Bac1]|nr:hypothetical protein [Pseudomonas sp. 5P_5.1_Bac1]MCU1722404.1 hypothetical protein [Pseudomonas sp. 5P_5.1_Bac1]
MRAERPILFSGEMVRAILDGRKTVTRRPVKGGQIPRLEYPGQSEPWVAVAQHHPRYGFAVYGKSEEECATKVGVFGACPYGQRGARLWVRETWAADAQVDGVAPRNLSQGEPIYYPADDSLRQTGCSMIAQGKCRPSIHMPRWASRIVLEISSIRIEQLHSITAEQAEAEGVDASICRKHLEISPSRHECKAAAIHGFAGLWQSTGGDWDSNPWVWVVEFQRIAP